MHSSRMRTGRTLTVFRWRSPPENLEDPPKNWRTPQKFGGTPPEKLETSLKNWRPLPVNRITHACENITLAKTSFRPVKMSTANAVTYHANRLITGWKYKKKFMTKMTNEQLTISDSHAKKSEKVTSHQNCHQ